MKTLLLGLVAALLLVGCTRYSNQVTTEGGGTLKTSVTAFGSKVDLAGIESDKELGPEGLKQSTIADAASGKAQIDDLAALMVAGAEMASSVTGRGGLDPSAQMALVNALSDRPTILTNNIRAVVDEMLRQRLQEMETDDGSTVQ